MSFALRLRLACGLPWRAVLGLAVGTIGCRRRDRWAEITQHVRVAARSRGASSSG
jgi:hypothetical protein